MQKASPLLLLIIIVYCVFNQVPVAEAWERTLSHCSGCGGSARAVAVDAAGNIITIGTINGSEVVKLSGTDGRVIWRFIAFGAGTRITVEDLALDSNGDVFVVAHDTRGVVKVSGASGTEIWRGTIGVTNPNAFQASIHAVAVDDDNNVVTAGTIGGVLNVSKLRGTDGTEIWRYEREGDAFDVAIDSSGSVVAVGLMNRNFATVKLRGDTGTEIWQDEINGNGTYTDQWERANALAIATDGSIAVAGVTCNRAEDEVVLGHKLSEVGNFRDFTVAKYRSDGDLQWVKRINGDYILGNDNGDWYNHSNDIANAVGIDKEGGIIAAGSIQETDFPDTGTAPEHFRVIKFDRDGNVVWSQPAQERALNQEKEVNGQAFALSVNAFGNVVAAGFHGATPRFTVVKYWGTSGKRVWRSSSSSLTGYNSAIDVVMDAESDVVAAGESVGSDGFPKFTVLKLRRENGEPYGIATAPQFDAPEIVKKYAPVVYLHSNDEYRPGDPMTFIRSSELRWSHQAQNRILSTCVDHPEAATGLIDASRLGEGAITPYTHMPKGHSSTSCDHRTDMAELEASDHTRPFDGSKRKNILGQEQGYMKEGFFLDPDNQNNELRRGIQSGITEFPGAPVFYEYVEHKYITYWFFYPYDRFELPLPLPDQEHEGDWERISIQLNESDEIAHVAFHTHDGKLVLPKEAVEFEGTHPVVFSAKGSHASYPSPRDDFETALPGFPDQTNRGPKWTTLNSLLKVESQPWYGFGGAWGEVGEVPKLFDFPVSGSIFTGPLGPSRYKKSEHEWDLVPLAISPVIFIPGIAGSVLNDPDDGRELWPGLVTKHDRLCLDPNDSSCITQLNATDAVRRIALVKQVYKPFLDTFHDHGYVEKGPGQNLFVFAYDWRKSNAVNATLLKNRISEIRLLYPNSKVDIVAHSMGGVLARRYILDNPAPEVHHVAKLISIGTPWLGAPKAIYALETGRFLENQFLVRYGTIRKLLERYPGAHELLPSLAFFQLGGEPFAESGWNINRREEVGPAYNYYELYRLLNGDGMDQERFQASQPYRANEVFHSRNAQDDWRGNGFGVSYYHLYGVKSTDDTIGQVVARMEVQCVILGTFVCRYLPTYGLKLTTGDGTVPLISATRSTNNQDYNVENAIVMPFFGNDMEHLKLTQTNTVQRKVLELLLQPPLPQILSKETSVQDSLAAPASQQAYYLKVAGITSAALKDEAGNTTDPLNEVTDDGLAEVTSYYLSPESFLAVLPTESAHTLTFVSEGNPMSLNLTKGTSVETVQAIRYLDLDLPAGTKVQLVITPGGVGALQYDSNGDGSFDTAINPIVSVTGEAAQDTEAPTITFDQASLAPASTRLTITATDAGSGVRSLFYSLNGTNFQPYVGPLSVNPMDTPVVYAFGEDNLANRSSLTTYTLTQTAEVRGTVTDSSGNGVSGVTITVIGSQALLATTDPTGNYSFFGLQSSGNYTVTPSKANYSFAPAAQTFTNLSGNQTANFRAALNPILLTELNSTRAIALDSVTFLRDPFPLFTRFNFSPDHRTRAVLFAVNVDLVPGQDPSLITLQLEDSQQRIFNLEVEYVGKAPNASWLSQIIIRLPDAAAGDAWVTMKLRGVASNKALISIKL